MRLIDADKLIDDYNKSGGTISDLMELILDAAEEATPPNDPLTLEELRKMEDEPIYIDYGKFVCCAFVNEVLDDVIWIFDKTEGFLMLPTSTLGKDWFAYRRNPEKEHNCNG